MEVLYSEKERAYNFIHKNGMQTSVKVSPSGQFTSGNLDRKTPITTDKNKYTVIVSSSLGCQMSCYFCHLTQNKKPFSEVTAETIIDNVIDAINYVNIREGLETRYIKLCFMGEGEPILDMPKVVAVTNGVLDCVYNNKLAAGLDGVDISTCMPKISTKNLGLIDVLDISLHYGKFSDSLNPYNHKAAGRSIVRLFYSLHHYSQFERNKIIPNTHTINKAMSIMKDCVSVNKVVHYMFMRGVNDSQRDIEDLVSFINGREDFLDYEFRVLRYNSCGDLDMESDRMTNIISTLEQNLMVKKFKVQYSAGEDIKAACGMFI